MQASRAIQLLEDLVPIIENLKNKYNRYEAVEDMRNQAEVVIRSVFDEDLAKYYIKKLENVRFLPWSDEHARERWLSGCFESISLVRAMIKNVKLLDEQGKFGNDDSSSSNSPKEKSNRIFIVHGHDEDMKKDVALFLYSLKLEPIILSDEANGGFVSVMEKFEKNAGEADFAIVLLSPDDVGYAKRYGEKTAKSRARQNVILELGYFIGKLGRSNVIAFTKLDENNESIEQPSDIVGGVIEPFEGNWQERIRKELKKAGYEIS